MRVPSGDQSINLTSPRCCSMVIGGLEELEEPIMGAESQIITVLSREPEAKLFPSGDQAVEVIIERCAVNPVSVSPESAFHISRLPWLSPEIMSEPSGDHVQEVTLAGCPSSVIKTSPVSASQIFSVLSPEAETIRLSTGDQSTSKITFS